MLTKSNWSQTETTQERHCFSVDIGPDTDQPQTVLGVQRVIWSSTASLKGSFSRPCQSPIASPESSHHACTFALPCWSAIACWFVLMGGCEHRDNAAHVLGLWYCGPATYPVRVRWRWRRQPLVVSAVLSPRKSTLEEEVKEIPELRKHFNSSRLLDSARVGSNEEIRCREVERVRNAGVNAPLVDLILSMKLGASFRLQWGDMMSRDGKRQEHCFKSVIGRSIVIE